MKVYKTEPNHYGWYYAIHKNKDGVLKIFRKCIDKSKRKFENDIWLSKEGVELLRKAIREKDKK